MTRYVDSPTTGYAVAFNITAATLIKTGPGLVAKVAVLVAGTTLGSVNDVATVGAVAVGNQLAAIPIGTTIGPGGAVIELEMPFFLGLVVTPGTNGVLSVSYS